MYLYILHVRVVPSVSVRINTYIYTLISAKKVCWRSKLVQGKHAKHVVNNRICRMVITIYQLAPKQCCHLGDVFPLEPVHRFAVPFALGSQSFMYVRPDVASEPIPKLGPLTALRIRCRCLCSSGSA